MNDEPTAPEGSESSETPPSNVPADFAGYVKWRKTGEPPREPENQPAAAAQEETPPAKTEPEPGPEEPQQDEEGDEEEEQEPQPAAGRRNGSKQRRIDRLTRRIAELEAQVGAASQPRAEPPKAEPPPGKPRLENYETLEAYQEALTDWNIDQREARRQAEADQKAVQEAEQKLLADWQSRQKAARKAHPDYDDVIESTAAPEGPGVLAGRQAMLEDEAGAEILYYLGTHPDELKRIAAMQPIAAVREIGRLSAILSPPSGAANGKQRFTAAPKPPPPSGRAGKTASDDLNDPDVQRDFKRWAKARETQLKGR